MHGCADIDLEQHGEIGDKRRMNPVRELGDAFDRHAAPTALVRDRGVDESIAQHPLAALERRKNHAMNVLEARREQKQRLGPREHGIRRIEQQGTDRVSDGRPAGLAGHHQRDSAVSQRGRRTFDAGGLASTVDAFEGDEAATCRSIVHRFWYLVTARL